MEYLIGIGCLLGVMVLGLIALKVYSMFQHSVVVTKTRLKSQSAGPTQRICACPQCRVNVYSEVKAIADRDHAIEVVIVCSACGTDSVWATLGDTPELRKFRPKNAKTFTLARPVEKVQSA